MKVLVDECAPRIIKTRLPEFDISTVQEMGWGSLERFSNELTKSVAQTSRLRRGTD